MKSLFEQIEEIVEKVPAMEELHEETVSVIYRHKTNKDDTVASLQDAIKRKLNFAEYEEVKTTFSLSMEIKKEIFGNENFKMNKTHIGNVLSSFEKIINELGAKPKIENSPFKLAKGKIFAKIQNIKNGTNKSCTIAEAEAERDAIYLKYNEVYKPKVRKVK